MLGGRLPRSRWLWGWAAVAGAGASLSLMGLSEGTSRAGPAVAAVLLNSAPFFVAIIGRLALHERITALRTAGLVVGFAGVALIILSDPGDVGSGSELVIGSVLTLIGALGYACSGLAMRYVYRQQPDVDVFGFSVAQFVWCGVLLIPYALFTGDPGATDWGSPDLWWSLLFLALGAQVAAFICFMLALGRWSGSRVYAWTFLAPGRRRRHRGAARQPAGRADDARHRRRDRGRRHRQPAAGGGAGGRGGPAARADRRVTAAPDVCITEYTDPGCPWAWSAEPFRRRAELALRRPSGLARAARRPRGAP